MEKQQLGFDIKKMSEETGIPVAVIKLFLHIPFEGECTAQTIAEASSIYANADYDSEEKALALQRWNELSIKDLEKANTLAEVILVFEQAPDNSEAADLASKKRISLLSTVAEAREMYGISEDYYEDSLLILKKWNELSLQVAIEAQTAQEAAEACFNAPDDSEACKLALHKWHGISLKAIEDALTIEEAKIAYELSPADSETAKLGFAKWISFFTSIEKIIELFQSMESNLEMETVVLKKWLSMVTSYEEADVVHGSTPEGSEVEELALKLLISLATTSAEANLAFQCTTDGSEAEVLALKKWDDLSLTEIEAADSIEKLSLIYEGIPGGMKSEEAAIKKMATFYGFES